MEHGAHDTIRDDDTTAIRQVVADAQRYQSEPEPFVALHAPDSLVVNIAGRRVFGRDSIHHNMKRALDTPLAHVLTRTEIEDIRFATPDVAIVSCIKHVSDKRDAALKQDAGARLPEKGSLTYVMVKDHGAWRIASAQTTPIIEP
ncbi:SgcJ/EcaC family oxidoreductase [Saccharomonospora sp. NPDC046836]|uniref:SgcJ/EcaC family oxidoreductase n=1 Tax=Saccharomonospora sp. NPDC046836 TaxID=3156921 RepID=UPI0033FC6028